jgi:hypothetical protein
VLDHEVAAEALIQSLGPLAPREARAYAMSLRRRGELQKARHWLEIAEAAGRLLNAPRHDIAASNQARDRAKAET